MLKHVLWLCLALAVAPAWSCYSGLGQIPTADLIPDGDYALELQVDGTTGGPAAETYLLNTQFGIGDRLEAGLDYDFSAGADPRLLVNAKYLAAKTRGETRALAVGVYALATKGKYTPYVVGTGNLSVARLHLGALRTDGKIRPFIGVDRDLSEKVNLSADYIDGDEHYRSVAMNYQCTDTVGLFGGVLFPNSDGDTLFTLHLVIGGRYRAGRKE